MKKIVENFRGKRVLVYGDLILDHYIYGYVERISREAPIPILRFERERFELGGGANAAKNLASLGAKVTAVGGIGSDKEGEELLSLFNKWGIEPRVQRGKLTLRKMRILAGGEFTKRQQVARVDWGNGFSGIIPDIEEEFDGAIISDYGYGTVSYEGFMRIRERMDLVVVDSRDALGNFKGATSATPNIQEFSYFLGERSMNVDEILREGERARVSLGLKSLLVTLGNKGLVLFQEGEKPFMVRAFGGEDIVDVTGAGDTVVATYTLALASGASFKEAAVLANIAGGISVMKEGASTVSPKELIKGIEQWQSSQGKKQ